MALRLRHAGGGCDIVFTGCLASHAWVFLIFGFERSVIAVFQSFEDSFFVHDAKMWDVGALTSRESCPFLLCACSDPANEHRCLPAVLAALGQENRSFMF